MKQKAVVGLSFLFLLFALPFINAAPPFIPDTVAGYSIEPVLFGTVKINEDLDIDVHVFNQTTGYPINSNVSCYLHLYNQTGAHVLVLEDTVVSERFDYEFYIAGGNFTKGTYWAMMQCNSSALGGSTEIEIKATETGEVQNTAQAVGSAVFLGLMLLMMCFFGYIGFRLLQSTYLWVLGVFFIFLSLLFLVYNTWLGYEYHLLLTGLPYSNTPQTIFYIFMTLLLVGILTTLALLFIHWKKVFRYMKQEIKRKEDNYEDVEDWEVEEWKQRGNPLGGGHFEPPKY